MGSFAATCSVSQLTISGGDDVVFLLLTENPYRDSIRCYPWADWFPRTYPLYGKYNDYGSVEGVADNASRKNWLDGLNVDIFTQGWGSNECHDVPTGEGMSFDEVLGAIQEDRLKVYKSGRPQQNPRADKLNAESTYETPPGVPTLKNITAAIVAAGFKCSGKGKYGGDDYTVDDDEGRGRVRVRAGSFDEGINKLRVLEKILEQNYAVMVAIGTGSYADSGELLVRPLPGTKDYHFSNRPDSKELLSVGIAMIRRDVWDALLALDITLELPENGYRDKKFNLAASVERAESKLAKIAKWEDRYNFPEGIDKDEVKRLITLAMSMEDMMLDIKCPVPGGFGQSKHLGIFLKTEHSGEDRARYIQAMGEFDHVDSHLYKIRHVWRPMYTSGPQYGDWGTHKKVLGAFKKIATSVAKRKDY
jgi:hypothetical protein